MDTIHDNKRYVGMWFIKDLQTATYRHKTEDITLTFEKMDNIIHTENLEGLISNLGINHAEAVKKISSL